MGNRTARGGIRPITKILLVMKLTMILLTAAFLTVSAKGISQKINYRADNAPLEKVLDVVKKQTGYIFLYDENLLKQVKPVSVTATNMPLDQFLKEVLTGRGIEFTYFNKSILLTAQPAADPVPVTRPLLQFPVTGVITDCGGAGLPGATILVKGSNRSAVTGPDGRFTLNANVNDVLRISYVGYESKECKIVSATRALVQSLSGNGKKNTVSEMEIASGVHICLSPAAEAMQEVSVVSTGYQILPKERSSGSFGQLSGAEIRKKATPNIVDRLEGTISGVLVNITQADAGLINSNSRSSIRVRGRNTINANQDPLVVVDGFPTELDLRFINPDDIENITVLKDAAAASIWGARSANGVIVIETRKGNFNKGWNFNYSSTLSWTGKPRLSYQPTLNSAQQIDLEEEMVSKNVLADPFAQTNPPPTTLAADILFRHKHGMISTEQKDAMLDELRGRDFRDQYEKYLLQQPFNQVHSISLSGGERFSKTYLSASYANEKPNAVGDKAQRITVDATHTLNFLEKFTFSGNFNVAMVKENRNGFGISALAPGINTFMPYDQIVDADGNRVQQYRNYYRTKIDDLVSKGYLPWTFNYLDELDNRDITNRDNTYRLNFGLDYKVIKGLTIGVKYMLEKSYLKTRNYANPNTYAARNLVNTATSINPATQALVYGYQKGGILTESTTEMNHYNLRGLINYSRDFGADHHIDAVAGAEMREFYRMASGNTRYGYNDRDLTSQPVAYGTRYTAAVTNSQILLTDPAFNTEDKDRYLSYYANAAYTFRNRYTITGSARMDDSNLFGADSKYRATPLWSAGAAWKINRETWFNQSWVDMLNLRLTYGVNGNVDKTTSPFLIATISGNDINLGQAYANISNPSNPYLRWEKTTTLNLGMDFAVLNNRISGSVEYYNKKNTDLLGPAAVNPTVGFTRVTVNTADMKGKGFEVTLNGKIIDKKDFGWESRITFAWNTNEVVKTDLQLNTATYYLNQANPVVGDPLDRLYSYRWASLDTKGQPLVYDETGKEMDVTKTISSNNALLYSGRTVPPYFGGWNNTFTWKGFELSALFTYKLGHVYRYPSGGNYSSYITQKRLNSDVANRWRKAGDEAITNVPGLPSQGQPSNYSRYEQADLLIRNADHVRLRELMLIYSFPAKMLGKSFLKGLQVSLQGRNLWIWTSGNQGIDPDFIPYEGQLNLPPAASVIGAVRINF
ncbi:TonB-linked SusC/RagA family outer membrane protein [Pseudobacter ginsenosidimutans]|uniref:TonB-linked SusC/RagA family outer membrane protein n=2 Tax=Pseudobacter ginsenosidimutans TaxID=661488 RepID=A0A4Q7N1U1_9BACT|nr:TonB-linked SusC/RagA family outer membrane protein [Pseudobacter ginsenosidimutans]